MGTQVRRHFFGHWRECEKNNKYPSGRAFCLDRLIPSPYSLTLADASYKGLRQQVSGIDRE
ncbi:MAG: hypothetical protein ACKPJJ_17530, partial [Planctomycetaceae bacterium]